MAAPLSTASSEQRGTHAYLGELQDVEHIAHSYYAVGSAVTLPLMVLPDIVLFPGDELPLRMLSNESVAAIREQLHGDDGAVLAVLCASQKGDVAYGTTVRIEKFSLTDHGGAAVTGAAKQRFRVRSRDVFGRRRTLAQRTAVEILAHPIAQRMPFDVPRSLRFSSAASVSRRRLQLPFVGYWSRYEYALFDVQTLVTRIQQTFASSAQWTWCCAASHAPERVAQHRQTAPTAITTMHEQPHDDPSAFAYWVAGHLPLSLAERLALLQLDCVATLLRTELALLEQCGDTVACAACEAPLASTRDIFSVGGTFVNPGGHVFQVLTLRSVVPRRVVVENVRSTQDSWFPGYAWSIAYCNACYQHVGWQFDAVDDDNDLSPRSFFGLRRAALTQSHSQQRNDEGNSGDAHASRHRFLADISGYDNDSSQEEVSGLEDY